MVSVLSLVLSAITGVLIAISGLGGLSRLMLIALVLAGAGTAVYVDRFLTTEEAAAWSSAADRLLGRTAPTDFTELEPRCRRLLEQALGLPDGFFTARGAPRTRVEGADWIVTWAVHAAPGLADGDYGCTGENRGIHDLVVAGTPRISK